MALADEPLDLLVVGGGVNGTGIARDAVGRGARVGLCEMGDLASATSSWSSKLIHGGLRYLEQYEFGLVRDSLRERDTLLGNGPHIMRPLRFLLPHEQGQRPAWTIRAGLFLYDHLHRAKHFPRSRGVRLGDTSPGKALKPGFDRGFEYADGWCDDSRLVVLNARDAAARGARVQVRTKLVAATAEQGRWQATLEDQTDGSRFTVAARGLVNAAGPWADQVIQGALRRNVPPRTVLVKGSHIITNRLHAGAEAMILQNSDGRVVFVIPFEGAYSLIGTTDFRVDSPDTPECSWEEVDYLCACVNRYFQQPIGRDDVVWSYAGVRPLYNDKNDDPSAVTRGYVLDLEAGGDQPPLLNVFGGKLTTYRRLSEQAVAKILPALDMRDPGGWTHDAPLPGGKIPGLDLESFISDLRHRYPWLPEALARRYARQFGTLADEVLGEATGPGDLGRHFGSDLYEREVRYFLDHEYARDAADILWRRTKQGLHLTADERQDLAAWLAAA